MGMMRDKIVLAVDKYDRFIAAKMLIELLMASRIDDIDMNDPRYTPELREIALNLQRGLEAKLTNEYQMKLVDGAWVPKTVKEIIRDIKAEMEEAKKQVKKVKSKGKKGRA
jgi:iron-sulfur cluster repair protein YtfE (RIC family)